MLDIPMLTGAAVLERHLQPRHGTPRSLRPPLPKLASIQTGIGEPARVAPGQLPVAMVDIGMPAGTLVAQPRLQPPQPLPDLDKPDLQRLLERAPRVIIRPWTPPAAAHLSLQVLRQSQITHQPAPPTSP